MFTDLLPPDIAVVIADDSMWETPLTPAEEQTIANSVDKRKREFRAGRNAAKQAIRQLGDNEEYSILPQSNRRPSWPKAYIGSITHTKGYCAAAIGLQQNYQGIGIDVEPNTPLKPDIIAHICTAAELLWIEQQSQDYWGKVFFCVKETLYKVFNPIHNVFLGFQEAEIELAIDEGTFSANIWQREHNIRCTYQGRFGVDNNFIYASMFLNHG